MRTYDYDRRAGGPNSGHRLVARRITVVYLELSLKGGFPRLFSEGVGFADLLLPYFGHLGIHTLVDSTILIDSGDCRIWLVLPRFQLSDAIAVLCNCLQLFKRGEEDRFHAESLGF